MNGLLSKNMMYFIAVMDERNISHAAQNLHITRSPLGKAIVELEVGIGSKLFIRKGNMLEPTEQAIHLYCQLKPVFENLLSIEERFFYKKTTTNCVYMLMKITRIIFIRVLDPCNILKTCE